MTTVLASTAMANFGPNYCSGTPCVQPYCHWCDEDQGVSVGAAGHSADVYVDPLSAPIVFGEVWGNEFMHVCENDVGCEYI